MHEYENRDDMVKMGKEEVEAATKRIRKLMEDIDGKEVREVLPIPLAADVFLLIKAAAKSEPMLGAAFDALKTLVLVCAYAGLMYGRTEHEK